jgi:phosphoglycerate dehydrogenase-like enzyme
MRVVVPDGDAGLRDPEVARIVEDAGHELVWHDGVPTDVEGFVARCRDADALLVLWSLPSGVLTACPSVRALSWAGTGVATFVDLDEAARCGVTVCNVPSYGANAIAEHALALLLAVARAVAAGDRDLRAGRWAPADGVELAGRRLGVVGLGPIGTRMAALGRALGMDVVAWTRTATPERAAAAGVPLVALEELFATADAISLHVAHTPATTGLVDAALLAHVRPGAILVNTARAEVVDRAALLAALRDGRLRGAGLDVFETEPLPADDPLLAEPRLVLTPHVAYRTPEASRELMRITAENLVAWAEGRPQHVVTGG